MVRKTQKAGRRSRHPKKGQMSRTRAGRRDFTTKKSSTKFNRRGHRQSRSARGVKRRPYRRRKRGGEPGPNGMKNNTEEY